MDYKIAGANYSNGTGTLTLPSGTQRFTPVSFLIEIINDSVPDNGETIILTIADGANYDVGSPGTVIFMIYEDSDRSTFRLTGVPRVDEDLTIDRTTSDPDGDGTLTYSWLATANLNNPSWQEITIRETVSTFILPTSAAGIYIRGTVIYTDGNGR